MHFRVRKSFNAYIPFIPFNSHYFQDLNVFLLIALLHNVSLSEGAFRYLYRAGIGHSMTSYGSILMDSPNFLHNQIECLTGAQPCKEKAVRLKSK